MGRRLAAGVAVAVLVGAPLRAASPEWAKPFLARPVPQGGWISEKDDWVILRSEIEVGRSAQGGLTRTFRQVLALIGNEAHELTVALDYDAEEQELVEPALWVPGGFGYKQVKLRKAGLDLPELDSGMVESERRLFITTKKLDPGEKAILSWQVTDRRPFPGEDVLLPFSAYPCAELVFRIEQASGAPPQAYYVEPRAGGQPRRIVQDHTLGSLPAARHLFRKDDPWLAAPLTSLPFFLVRAAPEGEGSWRDLSARIAGLFAEALGDDTERAWIAKARQIIAGAEEPAEKTARLAEFVQSLSYRNVRWGMGGLKPEPPSESLRSGSADCKGKAVLLQAMLAEAGVESVPVLCRIGPPYQDEPPVPTYVAFNHVVLAIGRPPETLRPSVITQGPGAGWALFDPTDPLAVLGQPPRGLEGSHALWLDPRGGDLFEVHTTEPGRRLVRAALDVAIEGPDSARFHLVLAGQSTIASDVGAEGLHGEDGTAFRSRLQRMLAAAVPGLVLDEAGYKPPDHLGSGQPQVEMRGTIPSPLQPVGGGLSILSAPPALLSLVLDVPGLDSRLPPGTEGGLVDIPEAFRSERCCQAEAASLGASVRLALPEGWSIQASPRMPAIEAPWLSASVEAGSGWTLSVEIKRGRFPTGSVDRRREDLARLSSLLRQPFVIETGDAGKAAGEAASR